MFKKTVVAIVLFIAILACQISKPAPTPTEVPAVSTTQALPAASQTLSPVQPETPTLEHLPDTPEPEQATPTLAPSPNGESVSSPTLASPQAALSPLAVDLSQPYAPEVTLAVWSPQPYAGESIPLLMSISDIANAQVLDGLTANQRSFLSQNGFAVIHSQEAQFGDIRVETARRTGQPYYLTTDAAFHALHLLFDDLLKSLEKEQLRSMVVDITQATLAEVTSYLPAVQGTSLETEAKQAVAYLSVALKLFNPDAAVDPGVADLVAQQVGQIMDAGGKAYSVVFPDFEDDYGAYKPVGHYAGDPELEAYFRGMTWYGRVHFLLSGEAPSRLPLIVTLALRRARVGDQPAADLWTSLYETLNFVIGPSDDLGPLEYASLMDTVYGDAPLVE